MSVSTLGPSVVFAAACSLFACTSNTSSNPDAGTTNTADASTTDADPSYDASAATDDDDTTDASTATDAATPVESSAAVTWKCQSSSEAGAPDYLEQVGCLDDFLTLASAPLDSSIPGARSMKFVVDLSDGERVYFQNSNKYAIHWEFATEHLSVAQGLPLVGSLSEFNQEYTEPFRRFLLGAVTYYESPDIWALEFSPYDTASAEMIALAHERVASNAYFGAALRVHATSEAMESTVTALPDDVPQVTTDEIFGGTDYQALNLAESYGRLTFMRASDLEGSYLTFRDIVVLDRVPNDISVTLGIITSEFQTPLSHINVLSQNRGTPNMALRDAFDDEALRALEGKWVRLEVGPFEYTLEEVTKEEADAWWDDNRPAEVQVPGADLDVTDLRDIKQTVAFDDPTDGPALLAAIKEGTRAFGGKAANYGAMAHIEGLPVPEAFAIPIYYYFQFMEENGFDERIDELLADDAFQEDPEIRDALLLELRDDMEVAPVNADFEQLLLAKLEAEHEGIRMRFRSSTNAEDLDGFTGAGLYTSKSGEPADPNSPVLDAVRKVWASVWFFRAFEERSYRSIDHKQVGMALLVHRSFPDEEANGVALTDNPFDKSGLDPAFYVNVQIDEVSVVAPPPGITTDSFLYYYSQQGQPTSYLSHSNLIDEDETVLSRAQVHELGEALSKIRNFFAPAYGPGLGSNDWWAMDVEFKFDQVPGAEAGAAPQLFVKQARPFGNR